MEKQQPSPAAVWVPLGTRGERMDLLNARLGEAQDRDGGCRQGFAVSVSVSTSFCQAEKFLGQGKW